MPGYGLPSGTKGLLPWTWAERRLRRSHNYWLTTVRPNASPHVMPGQAPLAEKKKAPPAAPTKLVDINRAGRKELMTLPGIGPDEATKIIANRPYLTKTELVTKGVLPTGPFLSLRYQVVAMQSMKPASGKTAEPAKAPPAAN